MESRYAYMWEYEVAGDHVPQFIAAYAPGGTWTQLFADAPGYIGTELHRDCNDSSRFVTIDYWESVDAWEAFREKRSQAFEALDAICETYTVSEREIGRFEPVTYTPSNGTS